MTTQNVFRYQQKVCDNQTELQLDTTNLVANLLDTKLQQGTLGLARQNHQAKDVPRWDPAGKNPPSCET